VLDGLARIHDEVEKDLLEFLGRGANQGHRAIVALDAAALA